MATLGGWQLAISRFSKKSELAWRFVAFMTSHAIQKRVTLSTGRAPARATLYNDRQVLDQLPQLKSLWRLSNRRSPPNDAIYVPLSNIMQRYFSSVLALPDTNIDKRGTGRQGYGPRAGSCARAPAP